MAFARRFDIYNDAHKRICAKDVHHNPSCSTQRSPEYSRLHPMIPRQYLPEWKCDMENRSLIMENARGGGIPTYEHDELLYLERREQMKYNVENRGRVELKIKIPDRKVMLWPAFHHPTSRHYSSTITRNSEQLIQDPGVPIPEFGPSKR